MAFSSGNLSEVARLRDLIDAENQSAILALHGPMVGIAKHDFITARMDRIGGYQEELAGLIGERESMALLIDILEQAPGSGATHA